MPEGFTTVIVHLQNLGFFTFLPFIGSLAVFYGLLKKSKIFGEPEKSVTINATVALVAAFMIWAYPFLNGISIEKYEMMLTAFFAHSFLATIIIVIGLLIADMFFPEGVGKELGEKIKGGRFWAGVVFFGILVGVVVFFSSSISRLFFEKDIGMGFDTDIIYSIITLVVLIAIVGLVVWFTGKEEAKPKS